ncbi:hypothetical protein D3C76_1514500 [compost metagenome]
MKCGSGRISTEMAGYASTKWLSCGVTKKLPKPSVQPMRTCPDNATPEPDTCSQAMCSVLSIDSA